MAPLFDPRSPRLSPSALLLAGLFVAIISVALAVWLAVNQPWLGLTLRSAGAGGGLLVVGDAGAPALDVDVPWRLRAIGAPGAPPIDLAARDLLEEPDFLRDYRAYEAFLRRQGRLYGVLQGERVVLYLASHPPVSVAPARLRPPATLPPAFWFQTVFAIVCLGIAVAVVAFRRGIPPLLLALTGVGLFTVGLTAAVYSTRELALPASLFRTLAIANHGGGMLFAGAFVSMLWHYPKPLTGLPAARATLTVFGVLWALDSLRLLPNVDAGFRYPLLVGLLVSLVLAIVQWRRLESPVDRAAMRWFAFAWLSGSSLYVGSMFLPVLLGGSPLLPQSYSFGLLLPIYVGVAVGVARYRLFRLERWWYPTLAGFGALLWVLLAAPVAAVVTGWSLPVALVAVVAAGGWVYFPLRTWMQRLHIRRRSRELPPLGEALTVLFNPQRDGDPDTLWRALLAQALAPMEIRRAAASAETIRISDDGSTLWTPCAAGLSGYELRWPARGRRLFDEADRRLIRTLMPLVGYASDLRGAWAAGAAAERQRIKTDLEDDLAARLYEQILRSGSDDLAAARGALAEVRLLIDQLDPVRRPLHFVVDEWHSQVLDICDQAGVTLSWQGPSDNGDRRLGPEARANPLRILREAIGNALRHSRPTHIEVAVNSLGADIELVVEYDSDAADPALWRPGRGLLNMRARARQLHGDVRWSRPQPGRLRLQSRLQVGDEK